MPLLSITMPYEGQRELSAALAFLTVIDCMQLLWHPRIPSLYRSGVRYQREDTKRCWAPRNGGCEDWLTIREVLAQGLGDCEDLACWRAAELRVRAGEPATAVAIRVPRVGWHIVVRRADGSIEDPSKKLGMGRKAQV